MAFDAQTIRSAIKTAQDHQLRYVRIKKDGDEFRATLAPGVTVVDEEFEDCMDETPGPKEAVITSPVVGYMKAAKVKLKVGTSVEAGQVVGEVLALGLANDVASPVAGEVVEVLVEDGAPLEYGSVIARVRVKE